LARASTTLKPEAVKPEALKSLVEQCWILLGARRGRIWLCRRARRSSGERCSVPFDGAWVLEREETRGDVVGFLHTHPDGPALPSERDVRTMRAWRRAFGKPLLCVIAAPDGLRAFRFDNDESTGAALAAVEMFPRGVVIGVDANPVDADPVDADPVDANPVDANPVDANPVDAHG
jgi:proteasome lid subunit RPN8/RPN11